MRALAPQMIQIATPFARAAAGLVLICAAHLVPERVCAQDAPRAEIGTSVGVTILSAFGESTTHIGIPGGIGPVSTFSPMLYATIFASPSVFVEPQMSISMTSGGGQTLTSTAIAGQVGYLFSTNTQASPYVAVGGAFYRLGNGSSASGPGLGGEIGYRFTVRSNLAIRMNGRYRRWFSDFSELNEFGFGLGLGAVL